MQNILSESWNEPDRRPIQFDRAKRALHDVLVCFLTNRGFAREKREQHFVLQLFRRFCCIQLQLVMSGIGSFSIYRY